MDRSLQRVNHQGHLAEGSRREVCFAEVLVRPAAAEIAAGVQCGKPRVDIHTGADIGRHKLPGNIRVVGCWAHARRKFDKALNAPPPDKREGTAALAGLKYCNKLFA